MTLSVDGLCFGYPGRPIGRDVSFAVKPGAVLALLGPNGGGKTTLLKTLLGLIPAQAGTITVGGRPLATLPMANRAQLIGYVPQAHAGAFAFSVGEVVLMGRTAHQGLFQKPSAKDHAIATQKLHDLGCGHLADRPYTMISGGERQLVLIARALAQEPRYVILDEPTASLDFGNQGKVMRQITTLRQSGLGVLFTTHDPNQALRHADHVALLSNGRLIASGEPSTILTKPMLETLYQATVDHITDDTQSAFLPA